MVVLYLPIDDDDDDGGGGGGGSGRIPFFFLRQSEVHC
jgi:hypothetical protein